MREFFQVQDLIIENDSFFLEAGKVARETLDQEIEHYSYLFDSISFAFSSLANRNLYHSQLFNNFCNYFFLIKLWKTKPCNVIVSSKALKRLLQNYINENKLEIQVKLNIKLCIRTAVKVYGRFGLTLVKAYKIKKIADKYSISIKDLKSQKNILMIDTYLLNGSFSSGAFKDRYFGEMFSWFKPKHIEKTIIVPNITAVTSFSNFDKELNEKLASSEYRFFFKEKLLSLSDYIFALSHMFSSLFFSPTHSKKTIYWGLVKEDIYHGSFSHLILDSFLTYSFVKKLVDHKIDIKTLLDWNENHLYDRAFAKGHSDFKAAFKLKSYQAVVLDVDHDFFIVPSKYEKEKGYFSNILCITGEGVLRERQKALEGINIEFTPLFRMNKVIEKKVNRVPGKRIKVLVALSIFEESSRNIINLLEEVAVRFTNVDFIVRCHPLLKIHSEKGITNIIVDQEADSLESLTKSDFLITSATSVCLEAAALGLKSIIVRELGHLSDNRVPLEFRSFFTREIATAVELSEAIVFYIEQGALQGPDAECFSEKIKRDYIMQVTDERIDYFLDF